MTRRGVFHVGAPIAWALMLATCREDVPHAGASIARCGYVSGDVRYRPRLVSAWEAATVGTDLSGGDWVQTAQGAHARIDFHSGSNLAVQPSSIVVVEEPLGKTASSVAVGHVSVRTGVVRGILTSSSGFAREVVVGTPDGKQVRLAAVPGSGEVEYRVTVGESGMMELAVTKGRAQITSEDGRVIAVGRGQAQDLRAGAVVGGVIDLPAYPTLVSPGIDATVTYASDLRVQIAWNEVPGAAGYFVEIAREPSFSQIVREAVTTERAWTLEPPVPGTYFLRVAARSAEGRQSEFGFARRLLVTEARAFDLLVAPADDSVIVLSKKKLGVTFSWQAVDPPVPYVLVVAKDSTLAGRVVLTQRTKAQDFEARHLGPGAYFWGVYAEREKVRDPLFTRPRKLTLRSDTLGLKVPKELIWGR